MAPLNFDFKTCWYYSLLKVLNERHLNIISEVLTIFHDFMKYKFLVSISFLLYWPGFVLFCYKYNWMDSASIKNISKTKEVKVHFKTDVFLGTPYNPQLYCRLHACYIFLFLKFSSLYCSCRNSQSLSQCN